MKNTINRVYFEEDGQMVLIGGGGEATNDYIEMPGDTEYEQLARRISEGHGDSGDLEALFALLRERQGKVSRTEFRLSLEQSYREES